VNTIRPTTRLPQDLERLEDHTPRYRPPVGAAYAAMGRRWANYQAAVARKVAEADQAAANRTGDEEDLKETEARA